VLTEKTECWQDAFALWIHLSFCTNCHVTPPFRRQRGLISSRPTHAQLSCLVPGSSPPPSQEARPTPLPFYTPASQQPLVRLGPQRPAAKPAAQRRPARQWPERTLQVPLDPEGRVTVLFDLNGVLIRAKDRSMSGPYTAGILHPLDVRPGIEHLLSLLPHVRLGVYTSATLPTVQKRLAGLEDALWGDEKRVCASCGLSLNLIRYAEARLNHAERLRASLHCRLSGALVRSKLS
jgi:hypothetical protein